jgi:gluconate kinase
MISASPLHRHSALSPALRVRPPRHRRYVVRFSVEPEPHLETIEHLSESDVAKNNYLVEGLSATGKSSVYDELTRRGYSALSTDRTWAYSAEPSAGAPSRHDNWKWDKTKAIEALKSDEADILFVCGSSRNRDDFLPHFSKIFNLKVDDETMMRRLADRTNNDFGKKPEEVQLMVALNREGEKPAGAIDIDASKPLKEVVDEILGLCGLDPSGDS